MSLVKVLLFTLIFALTSEVGLAQPSAVEIMEVTGGLDMSVNGLKTSITTDAAGIIATTADTNVEASGGSGTGAKFSVAGHGSTTTGVNTITCTSAGSGYKAGDVLTLTRAASTAAGKFVANAAGNIQITLSAADINGYVKVTPSSGGFYRNVDGGLFNSNGNFASAKKTGYYVALGKATQFIALKVDYGSGETVMPQIGGVTDTGLSDNGLSTKLLPVKDGLNVLELVSSAHGTYVMNLIKPDDKIKKMKTTDRSIEIAYNLAAVGEFTCAAFKGDVSDPSTRAGVKGGDSVNTYKVMQEEIFNSVQMTLNGLIPN